MKFLSEENRFVAGIVAGAGGAVLACWVGPRLADSGSVPMACALILCAAALWTSGGYWQRKGIEPRTRMLFDRGRSSPSGKPFHGIKDQAVRGDERFSDLVNRLPETLIFLPGNVGSIEGMGLSEPVSNLAVALAARSVPELREDAMRLFRMLDDSFIGVDDEGNFSPSPEVTKVLVRNLTERPGVVRALDKALFQHATRETVILALLEAARQQGPLGTSAFGWLRDVDWRLWCALDNHGRQTFHADGIAAMCHYRHEVETGTRLEVAHVKSAQIALLRHGALLESEVRERPGTGGEAPSEPDDAPLPSDGTTHA